MNTWLGLFFYAAIGGLIAGMYINARADKCGPQHIENVEYAAMVITWPSVLASALVVRDGALKPSECKESDRVND